MKITDSLHAFPWTSMSANNCNTYLIDGAAKILIDPGHYNFFSHVAGELNALGIEIGDIDLVVSTHGHPDHFEGAMHFRSTPALFAIGLEDWRLIRQMRGEAGLKDLTPDFFLGPGQPERKGNRSYDRALPGAFPRIGSVVLARAQGPVFR